MKPMPLKRLTRIALLASMGVVGRLLLSSLPNVQPVTVLVMLIALNFSLLDGVLVAALIMVLSNLFLGMGPWTLYQIVTYCVLVFLVGLFRKPYHQLLAHPAWTIGLFLPLSFAFGMVYGFVISFFGAYMIGAPNFWVYYFQGLPYDLAHAFGNAVFFILLNPVLGPLMRKMNK